MGTEICERLNLYKEHTKRVYVHSWWYQLFLPFYCCFFGFFNRKTWAHVRARNMVGFGTCWDSWFAWRLVFLGDKKLFYLLGFLKSYFGHRWGFKDSQVLFPIQGIWMQRPKDKDQSIFELSTGLILDNLLRFLWFQTFQFLIANRCTSLSFCIPSTMLWDFNFIHGTKFWLFVMTIKWTNLEFFREKFCCIQEYEIVKEKKDIYV